MARTASVISVRWRNTVPPAGPVWARPEPFFFGVRMPRRSYVVVAVSLIALSFVSSNARAQLAAPQPIGGISCDAMEGSRLHIHQHLSILDRGHAVPIPPNVGQVP